MKKKVLFLFKYPWHWNKFVINKLSKFYQVEHLYIDKIQNKNFSETINEINNFIKAKNIEIVFFDVDYFRFMNFYFIKKIQNAKKILVTWDDYELHEINSLTAAACHLVLSSCPLSVLKYKEKGIQAHQIILEGDGDIFKNHNQKKDIDVLFFGGLGVSPDRKNLIDFIKKQGISISVVGKETKSFATDEELSKLVSRSKIVLNLSKSTWGAVRNYPTHGIYKFYYHFKGRVVIAGLCGTACVSEFFPACELLFGKNVVPTFYTKEECVEILKKILNDPSALENYTKKLSSICWNFYEDKKNFKPIYDSIEKIQLNKSELIEIPYWYQRICAKMIILRNIRNSSLLKVFSAFRDLFPVFYKSNIVTKFMIATETVLNIFWYYFKPTFKTKK